MSIADYLAMTERHMMRLFPSDGTYRSEEAKDVNHNEVSDYINVRKEYKLIRF